MARAFALLAAVLAGLAAASQAGAQPPGASLEARLRALEARVAALEARAPAASAPAATGPACRKLNVNGSAIPASARLGVTVNSVPVASLDGNVYLDLEPFMRPGPNAVALAFAAPAAGAEAELRCLPPGVESSRSTLLTLRPAAGRLRAEATVVLAGK